MKNSQHEHDFVAEKFSTQEPFNEYLGSSTYHKGILQIEKVAIFCRVCGESKVIENIRTIEVKSDE